MSGRNSRSLAKLSAWAKRFETLASPAQKGALTKQMSKATLDLIEEGFRKESSPYGQRWKRKRIPNGQKTLVEKDRMRQRFRARVGVGKFSITNPQPYTNTHNYGDQSRNIPKRQIWPSANRLPAKYVREYTVIFQNRALKIVRGRK